MDLTVIVPTFNEGPNVVELLRRNPDADFDEIRKVCRRYRLRGLAPLLRELED